MPDRVTHSLVAALRQVPDFRPLDEQRLLDVVGCSANLFWREGEAVFEAGDPAEGLYIVLSGKVTIIEPDAGELATIGPGDFFGELSLLLDTTHRRTARVAEDAEIMVVPKEPFQGLLTDAPELAEQLRRKADARLGAAASESGGTDDVAEPR